MEAALSEIRGKTSEPSKNVTLISSSSVTVVAAQAALLLVTNREAYGLGEIHLVLEKYKIMPVFSGRFIIKNWHNLFGMFYSLPRPMISPTKERRGSSIRMIRQISGGPAGGLYSVFPSPS